MTPLPHGFLTRRDRQPCAPVAYFGRRLGTAETGAVVALHRRVRDAMPPGTVAKETDRFFADHVEQCGCILGLFAEDALIAYGVLGLPGPDDPNFGDMVGLPETARRRVAHIDGVSVTPAWRGNRLQRVLVKWRLDVAADVGRAIALSTAAPGNLPSVCNLLAEGLTIRALLERFGGWRYVFRRDLDTPLPPTPGRGRWIDLDDMETQQRLFQEGAIAWSLKSTGTKHRLWFAPAACA